MGRGVKIVDSGSFPRFVPEPAVNAGKTPFAPFMALVLPCRANLAGIELDAI